MPLGVKKIVAQHPHAKPEATKNSPAPQCHASSRERRQAYIRQYRAFLDEYRVSSREWLNGLFNVEFPLFCFRPPLIYATRGEPSIVPT